MAEQGEERRSSRAASPSLKLGGGVSLVLGGGGDASVASLPPSLSWIHRRLPPRREDGLWVRGAHTTKPIADVLYVCLE